MGTTEGGRWPSVSSTLPAERRAPGEQDGQGSAAPFMRRPAASWTVAPQTLPALLCAALLVLLGYVCSRYGQRWRHRQEQERSCSKQAADGWPLWAGKASEPLSEAPGADREHRALAPVVLVHTFAAHWSSEICRPWHWRASGALRLHTLLPQGPSCAIVEQTDTHRFHLLVPWPTQASLSCADAWRQEVFRLPLGEHYAPFVFAAGQELDGFATLAQARQTTQTLVTHAHLPWNAPAQLSKEAGTHPIGPTKASFSPALKREAHMPPPRSADAGEDERWLL